MRTVLLLRYPLRILLAVSRAAVLLDGALVGGATSRLARLPEAMGEALSRVQSGSLTEYLLLVFSGLALLVLARLFA